MSEAFPITPASGAIFWVIIPVALLLIGGLALFGYLAYSANHVQFEVSPDGVQIKGDMYGRLVPAASLETAQAREIDLNADSDHRLSARTNGAGLPGYKSGWFRLANGEKALVFVTDTSHVIYLPTRDGYSLLLSPAQPAAFIASLKQNFASITN